MFNEYSVFQLMKFRQEETERNARDAWKFYVDSSEKKSSAPDSVVSADPCCQCACA